MDQSEFKAKDVTGAAPGAVNACSQGTIVFGLFLIGWEKDASSANQSQCAVKQSKGTFNTQLKTALKEDVAKNVPLHASTKSATTSCKYTARD